MQRTWRVKRPNPALQYILSRELGVSSILAQLMINRGIYTVEQGRFFLGGELERLYCPLLLKDMEPARDRILKAIKAGEKILVYGDYDADGLTGTVLLVRVLRRLGGRVSYYIPHRLVEGYGLHLDALRLARQEGTRLIITIDCGISAIEEVAWARSGGMEVIITDHHEPPAELPPALAVINPKQPGCPYPFKELAGVGVAFKLVQALLEATEAGSRSWEKYLDLVCLGTIADIVPLQGENRILVKNGLLRLACTTNPGLQALIAVSGIKAGRLGAQEVAFGLAPRLNAAGRVGDPRLAAELLLCDKTWEAWEIACRLHDGNLKRQKIESEVLADALVMLEKEPELARARVLVLASAGWHPGVIGVVASRLLDRFYRPALLIALNGSEGKGSARSIPGFNIYKALDFCREHLLVFGGHARAAGFSLAADSVDSLREAINCYAENVLDGEQLNPWLDLDGIIEMGQVSEELVAEFDRLSPFGHHNPGPLLGCRQVQLLNCRGVGKSAAHLKMRLRGGDRMVLDGIGFNLGGHALALATGELVDLAFIPAVNEYNGYRSVQLEVKDLRQSVNENDKNDLAVPGVVADKKLPGKDNPCAKSIFKNNGFLEKLFEDAEEILRRETTALFTPEFILNIFKKGNLDRGSAANSKEVNYLDFRGCLDRPAYLAGLAGQEEERVLVFTTCGFQTIELAQALRLSVPGLRGRVAFYNQALAAGVRSALGEMFESGKINMIILTAGSAEDLQVPVQNTVLYHLPFDRCGWSPAVRAAGWDGKPHLLFGTEDLAANRRYLEMLSPGRDNLAKLYTVLRQEVKEGFASTLDCFKLARVLAGSGFPQAGRYTLEISLAVLAELGLLYFKKNRDGALWIKMTAPPREKLNLDDSQTFRQFRAVKEESLAWMKKLLEPKV